jgi:thiol-disulfide isomerase/thioredoxin
MLLAAGDPSPAVDMKTLQPTTPVLVKETKVNEKTYLDAVVTKKKVVFVDFWASYCLPCLDEIPGLQAMKDRLGKDADVVFVNVDPTSTDLSKVLGKKSVKLKQTFRVDNDDPQPFINAVDPKWMGEVPFGALYDKNGKLVKTFSGEQKIEDIEKAIREVIALK